MRTTRNKEEERKKILLILGGSIFLTAVLGTVAYLEYGKVKRVRRETESIRAQISSAEQKREKVPELEREVIVLRENVAEYVKILPDDREINDFVSRINRFADESGVVITSLEDVIRRDAARKTKDPFERVVYKMNISGDINEFMKFMSLFESHERFVNIPRFDIKAGRAHEGDRKVRHDIEMQIETFVYDAGGGMVPTRVTIPDYERKRELYRKEIIDAREDVSIEKYVFKEKKDRRDPFLDPRISAADAQARELALQKKLLSDLQDSLGAIEKGLARENGERDLLRKSDLRRRTDEAIRDLAGRVRTARDEEWFTASVIAEEFQSTVEERLSAIVRERGLEPGESGALTTAELAAARDQIRELYEGGKYEDVIARVETLAPGIDPVEKSEEFLGVLDEITNLREHASAILDFQSRAIEIQGIVFRPEGSAAIINGMVLVAGDPVDDEVVIGSIREDEIEFEFRNIRISKLVQQ